MLVCVNELHLTVAMSLPLLNLLLMDNPYFLVSQSSLLETVAAPLCLTLALDVSQDSFKDGK